jgi:myo-inositol-1(or 4)-monophosphatase
MEGFWEQALKPWDVMGGALIVQEAGGRVTNIDGSPWDAHRGNVLATNGLIHDEMLRIVEVAGVPESRK